MEDLKDRKTSTATPQEALAWVPAAKEKRARYPPATATQLRSGPTIPRTTRVRSIAHLRVSLLRSICLANANSAVSRSFYIGSRVRPLFQPSSGDQTAIHPFFGAYRALPGLWMGVTDLLFISLGGTEARKTFLSEGQQRVAAAVAQKQAAPKPKRPRLNLPLSGTEASSINPNPTISIPSEANAFTAPVPQPPSTSSSVFPQLQHQSSPTPTVSLTTTTVNPSVSVPASTVNQGGQIPLSVKDKLKIANNRAAGMFNESECCLYLPNYDITPLALARLQATIDLQLVSSPTPESPQLDINPEPTASTSGFSLSTPPPSEPPAILSPIPDLPTTHLHTSPSDHTPQLEYQHDHPEPGDASQPHLGVLPESSLPEELLDAEEGETGGTDDSTTPECGKIRSFLLQVKIKLSEEIQAFGRPQCYRDGSFWVRAKDPFFANIVSGSAISPDTLYERDIFVWLPCVLVSMKELSCPRCQVRGELRVKGENYELGDLSVY